MDFIPQYEFRKCVERYNGNYKIKSFSCWDQYLCMAFAQFTFRESLRDIQACLRVSQQKLYHMGFRGKVSRNTLAHANQVRDWRIYADFAHVLIKRARSLYIRRSLWCTIETSCICTRFHNDRSLPIIISMGKIQKAKGSDKTSYSSSVVSSI